MTWAHRRSGRRFIIDGFDISLDASEQAADSSRAATRLFRASCRSRHSSLKPTYPRRTVLLALCAGRGTSIDGLTIVHIRLR